MTFCAAPYQIPHSFIMQEVGKNLEILREGFYILVFTNGIPTIQHIEGQIPMIVTDLEMRCEIERRRGHSAKGRSEGPGFWGCEEGIGWGDNIETTMSFQNRLSYKYWNELVDYIHSRADSYPPNPKDPPSNSIGFVYSATNQKNNILKMQNGSTLDFNTIDLLTMPPYHTFAIGFAAYYSTLLWNSCVATRPNLQVMFYKVSLKHNILYLN